jgi:Big-like domain-containing protein
MRPWILLTRVFAAGLMAVTCLAQTSPAPSSPDKAANGSPSASASSSAAAPAAEPEADTDSADIPAIARGRISEEEYFALRDQQIRMQRGIDDLVRNPLQRTNAIRTMELQEFFLHQLRTGGAPLGALAPAATNVWTPLGPAPIPNGQTFGTVLDPTKEVPVSGRVTAIAIDPTDATGNTVYVGTAQGGLYRTLDGGANWTPLMDAEPSLAIGAITIDPLDHTKVFVGTGEGNNSGDSFFGVGLFIILSANSANPNVTGPFNSNGTSDIFTGRSITQILVDPADDNKVLVSTGSGFSGLSFDVFNNLPNRGVYLSTNALSAGPTFTQLTIQTASPNRIVSDMVMDPGNPAKVLVNVVGVGTAGDGGVWSSNSDPFTGNAIWTQQLILGGTGGVVGKFAVNRVGTTTTFALAASDSASCGTATKAGTLRTSLDGATWTAVAGATGFCGGQCIYDAPVGMDPGNAHVIYVGGNGDSSSAAALSCGTAALAKTTDGATFNRSDVKLHPDSHAIAIVPSNSSIIYTGNDGGIFKSVDAGATWTSLNTASFSATQFQSLALHPKDANFMIGGTQDNGTELMNSAGAWTRSDGGDGGFALIDQSSPDTTNVTMYHTYFNQSGATTGQIGYARVTNIAKATDAGWTPFFGCPATATNGITANGIDCNDNVLFYAPMALGPGTPNTLYFGTDHLYRSPDQGVTMTAVSQAPFAVNAATGANFPVSSIGISPQNDNVRIVGLTDGQVFATTSGANPIPEVTGPWGTHYVARAVIDPTNPNTAYVSLDGYGFPNHVWKTTNLNAAPPTWTAASGGLPDVPVNAFVVDPVFPSSLFAGTDVGVFNSIDGGASWTPYGSGLPRVAVFDMAINSVTRKLRIATHGKGIWEIALISPTGAVSLAADHVSIQTGTTATLTASVAQGNAAAVPTGTITFNDGATALGPAVTLNASATASLLTGPLSAGLHNITAAYSGDANFAASTSAVVVIDVGAPDYAVAIPNSSATISAGQTATINIDVSPQHGFSGAISFSCSGLPAAANCTFNPPSINASGTAASTTLTISTTARTLAASIRPVEKHGIPALATALFAICGVILLGAGKKRKWQSVTLMLCALALVGGMIACGGGNPPPPPGNPGTPAGTFSVVVTATSGSTSHTSTVKLTVR